MTAMVEWGGAGWALHDNYAVKLIKLKVVLAVPADMDVDSVVRGVEQILRDDDRLRPDSSAVVLKGVVE